MLEWGYQENAGFRIAPGDTGRGAVTSVRECNGEVTKSYVYFTDRRPFLIPGVARQLHDALMESETQC